MKMATMYNQDKVLFHGGTLRIDRRG